MSRAVLAVLVVAVLAAPVRAGGSGFGAGIIVGEPTGISFKLWLGPLAAVDAAAAWSFAKPAALHVHADFLWHSYLLDVPVGELPLYYGLGGRVKLVEDRDEDSDFRLGARIPVGIEYLLGGAPLGFFFELAPVMNLMPKTSLGINFAIGGRVYFR